MRESICDTLRHCQDHPPRNSSRQPRGITVNAVSLGRHRPARGAVGGETLAATAHMIPLGRLGLPADVVAFLVGPGARWVTGQNVRATGGLV